MINSLGAGSGLDLGGLVDNLVAIERQSAEGPLNRRQARTELRVSALGSLRASVSSLQSALSALDSLSIGRRVTSSFEEAVTGTATTTADIGSYLVNVSQIAVAQSLATDDASKFADADAELGEGTLTITIGSDNFAIELMSGQNSLRDVRDAINASSANVQASLVQDGDEYLLLLTSGQTGSAGVMTVTVDGTIDTRLASANMDQTTAAQDANFTVNGLSLSSASNTIENVLPGVTLELAADSGGLSVEVNVTSDTQGLADKLSALVNAYNALSANMGALGGASPNGLEAGPLVGDASLRSLQRQTGAAFFTNHVTDVIGNPYTNLVQLGIHKGLDGLVDFEAAELQAALADNEGGVEALVAAFAENFGDQLRSFVGSNGILDLRVDQLNAELLRIGEQREDLDRRMSGVEARLRARFSALDSLVTQFNNTSAFLDQQLEVLKALRNTNTRS